MKQHTFLLCVPLFLLFFLLPQVASAQSFRANSIDSGSGNPSKPQEYVLNLKDIHAYVQGSEGLFSVSFEFEGTGEWEMELERYDLRSNSYRLMTSRGSTWSSVDNAVVTYKGKLSGKPGSDVRMTIADGYLRALIKESDDSLYYFDMIDTNEQGSVVTVIQGDPDELHGNCASGDEHYIHLPDDSKKGGHFTHSSVAPYETEIAFVVDRIGYQQYDSLEELELELLTIMNYTDAYYAPHKLTYKLTEIYVIEDLQSQPWEESSDAGQMLDNFTAWASNSTPLMHHDVVTLWSGIDFGSTIGIAWIGTIGSPYRQNIVNFPKGRERRNSNVHAHELGHNWGSGHVGSGGWIMSAALSGANEEGQWHQSTINAFPGYVADAMEHLEDVGEGDGDGDGGDSILSVSYSQITVTEDENGSGMLDPGETANLTLTIENLDANPITNLQVTIVPDNNRAVRHVTLNDEVSTVEILDGNTAASVSFNVTLSLEAPVDRSYRFLFELTDGANTSETTLSIISGDQLLPVDLVSFTGYQSGEGVLLQWETASEFNNAGFDVEVQEGQRVFRRVAFVQGAGTTLEAQSYTHLLDFAGFAGTMGFRLKQIDFDGTFEYSDTIYLDIIPAQYALKQNFPNPFNPQTRIEFLMPVAGQASLEVFDMLGRRVAVLVDGHIEAGQHSAVFNAQDLSNGIYLYRLSSGAFEETRTMLLMK